MGELQRATARGRVMIVDADPLSARVLEGLLHGAGFEVCTTAHKPDEIGTIVQRCTPDLVLMALDADSVRAAHALRRELDLRVVYVTDGRDQALLADANETLPYAYLLRPVRSEDLQCCLALAMHKRRLSHPVVQRGLEQSDAPSSFSVSSTRFEIPRRLQTLSARELEVLRLIGRGHTSKGIAERLQIAKPTVDTYRQRLTEKLAIKSRAELMRVAAELGLLAATPELRAGD
jgi:two-component system response regulator NreC